MTVTPAAGFVGWMAIRISVQQSTATPPNANDFVDRQIIRIRVLPAGPTSALARSDNDGDVDHEALDEVMANIDTVLELLPPAAI